MQKSATLLCRIAGIVLAVSALLGQSTSQQDQLIRTVLSAGAYVEAYTQFCEAANRTAYARDDRALKAWAQRNHWTSIQARLNADAALKTAFLTEKQTNASTLAAHRFKTALSCGSLPQELHLEEHDPSVTHGAELAALESARANAASALDGDEGPAPSANAATVSEAPVESSSAGGESLTAGAATFVAPAGWQVAKSSPEMVILQTVIDKTKALIVITEAPLSGDFRSGFESAVRSQYPGTGLKLAYVNQGTTAGGSPALYVRDTGVLRGSKQYEAVSAVGVNLGNKMQLALLLSSNFGAIPFKCQDIFKRMITEWRLSGERGAVWNPLQPSHPVGARAGFFVGYGVQNQLNPLGGMNLNQVRQFLVLLPTGQAFHGMPTEGRVLDMNFGEQCSRMPTACGTYQVAGGRISFTWRGDFGLVSHESCPLIEESPGHAVVRDFYGTVAAEVPPARDLRINGRYTSSYVATGTIGQSTSVVAQTYLSLSVDGRYQKSGFSSASFSGNAASGTVQSRRGLETGTYRLNGYALVLAPSSGSAAETFTVVFDKPGPSPQMMILNDKLFMREGR